MQNYSPKVERMAQELEQLARAHGLTTRDHDPRPLLASLSFNRALQRDAHAQALKSRAGHPATRRR